MDRFLASRLWRDLTTAFTALPLPPILRRAGSAVALALALAAVDTLTGGTALRVFSLLHEWLAAATVLLVVLLVARIVAALQRWRLGASDVRELTHTARSVFMLALSPQPQPQHQGQRLTKQQTYCRIAHFIADLKRFLLVYVLLALDDCREGHDATFSAADQLCGLLDDSTELSELHRSETNRPRAAVIELWIRARVHRASFSTTASSIVVLPHGAVVAMELQRMVSTLPLLYENTVRAWSQPPVWRVVTAYTPQVVMGYLVFLAAVRATTTATLLLLLTVFLWGFLLFALDALADSIENRASDAYSTNDDGVDTFERALLNMQNEIDAAAHAFFRTSSLGLAYWEQWNRHIEPLGRRRDLPRPTTGLPRSSSSIAPASPRRSPQSGGLGSPGADDDGVDGLRKPSLKRVLDLITTSSPSTVASQRQAAEGTAAERQPLLSAPTAPIAPSAAARYNLFLRRDDESSGGRDDDSDATDVDEEEEGEEAEQEHGYRSV